MADAKEELSCPITYEELRDIEKEFEDVETEISKWTLKKIISISSYNENAITSIYITVWSHFLMLFTY